MAESTIKPAGITRALEAPADWDTLFTTVPLGSVRFSAVTNADTAAHAPTDSPYKYGLLFTYKGSSTWNNLQVYVPASGNAGGHRMYVRTDAGASWDRFDRVDTTQVSISVANWNATTTCLRAVTGVTASNRIIVSPAPESIDDYVSAGVYCSAQSSGGLTFKAKSIPTADLVINVMIMG